jgi:hypothetical protein
MGAAGGDRALEERRELTRSRIAVSRGAGLPRIVPGS